MVTDKLVSRLRKTFANGSSANIKVSKIQVSKMIQLGGPFLGSLGRHSIVLPGFVVDSIATSVGKTFM